MQAQINTLKPVAEQAVAIQRELGLEIGLGLQVQFVGVPDVELPFESLGSEVGKDPKKKIEVLSVWNESGTTYANVFVPDGKLDHFERYITDYIAERKKLNGDALDHRGLLDAISSIRRAELRALWTDDAALLPEDPKESFWWEAWLPIRGNRDAVVADFRKLASLAGCEVSEHQINFPERTVLVMYGSQFQLSASVMTLNCVAELRRAKETADFFDGMPPLEQKAWIGDAHARMGIAPEEDSTPRVCLLDSGVNRMHPLLEPLIAKTDLHTVNPAWGVDDTANHGTGIAGLVALGDFTDALGSADPLIIQHRLESVKLTPEQGANSGDSRQHGFLFGEAASRPEGAAPNRPRVFVSAVTSTDDRDRGRPSAWSATVDRLAADYDGNGQFPRLFVLCTGNSEDPQSWNTYPASLDTSGIRDPGQAWNALTVGAYTEKTRISEKDAHGYTPIASKGELSPYTRTSLIWDKAWPLKPDVVFEGGNAGKDALGAVGITSLHLLTANNQPLQRLLTTTNATSAASALGARMAAQLMAAYPLLRPETIRALIAHSADWTEAMRSVYLPASGSPTKTDYVNLVRRCGWGVPSLERALWSASNSLTLVVEDQLHPYKKDKGKPVATRDMNLHSLPWPKEQLLELPPDTQVEMRVTLSYFVEPNPSSRGTLSKFHYPSHRLRFDVQRPLDETTETFMARLNALALREDEGDPINPKDPEWIMGSTKRHRGSLHQDIWRGTAAALANRGFIAVYPASGWWRTRPSLERYDLAARYSLLVSIRTPRTHVDIYTPVANVIKDQAVVPVFVST